MKNKHLVMLLLSSCCLAACVDSKYDLSDVNTDDAVMGESWVIARRSGNIGYDDTVRAQQFVDQGGFSDLSFSTIFLILLGLSSQFT